MERLVTQRVSVVVCAYSEQRWGQTRGALASVVGQQPKPAQVILVVDHNSALAAWARSELAQVTELGAVTVLESDQQRGLSGARNCGLRAATEPITTYHQTGSRSATSFAGAGTRGGRRQKWSGWPARAPA